MVTKIKENKNISVQKQTALAAIPDMPAVSYPWYYYVLPTCLLSVVTFLFYYPSLHYDFQFDDIANIAKHYDIRNGRFWEMIFSGPRWIGHWLNTVHYSIGKFDPYSYRLGNVIQHTVLGLILFFFFFLALKNLKKQSFFRDNAFFIALLTSALFLLHPVQTQTVSYVIQGKLEGMAAFFIASLVLCFYLTFTVKRNFIKVILLALFFVLAAFSTGSKEVAIVSPLLILMVDWFFIAQGYWPDIKSRLFFHIANTGLIVGLYLYLLKSDFFIRVFTFQWKVNNNLGNVITSTPLELISPWSYFISEFKVILHYLWIFIWPFNISVEYDWVLSKSFFAPDCFIPFMILMFLAVAVFYLFKRNHASLVVFGFLWFLICIAPRSSIIASAELIVDYKTYTASIGWLFLLASVLVFLVHTLAYYLPKIAFKYTPVLGYSTITSLLALGLGLSTMQRNTVWRSGVEFWGNMLKNAPGKARIYNNYGVELSQKLQKYEESIPFFQRAISMDKHYPDPHNNLAVVYAYLNKIDEAIVEMKEGLRINPHYAEGYNNLAAFYLNKKQLDPALENLNRALKIRPSYGKAYFNRARIYAELGKNDLALADLKSACTRADLDNDFGYSVYGKFALDNKYFDDALYAFTKLVEMLPQNHEAYFNLGNAYYLSNKFPQAKAAYVRSVELNPHDARSFFNLGETYLKLNDPAAALTCFVKINITQAPHVALKIADCHAKMGHSNQAKNALESLMNMPIDQTLKDTAKTALASLNNIAKST